MSSQGTLIKHRYPIEYYDNVDISSVEQISYKKSDIKSYIDECKSDLLALALATPKDIVNDKNDIVFDVIKQKVNDILDGMSEHYYDYWTVEHIERITDDWHYGWRSDEYELFTDSDSNEEINLNSFPKEQFVDTHINKKTFSFTPQDDDVQNVIDRAIQNIELTDNQSEFYKDKYVIFYHNKNTLFVNYDGQFIFKSEEAAKKVLHNRFNINAAAYISGDFITNHSNFFDTLIQQAIKYKFDEETINKFRSSYNSFIERNYKYAPDNMGIMYDFIESVITKIVCEKLGLKIVKVSDIINLYK